MSKFKVDQGVIVVSGKMEGSKGIVTVVGNVESNGLRWYRVYLPIHGKIIPYVEQELESLN